MVFERDPVNLLRLFWFADKHGLEYHPNAMQLVTRSLKLITRNLRKDGEANRLFLDVLTSDRNPELNLRRMNESGVLGRLIPEFGKIVAMMQFNMYHHYTVDEHLLRCIGILSEIERGEGAKSHPLSHALMPGLKKQRELLYVALLLHDIAKGRPGGPLRSRRQGRPAHMSAYGPVPDRYGDRGVAGRAASADVDDGADPRPQRPQDDRRFRGRCAVGRTTEDAAGADRMRHTRCWPGRLERMEGSAAAGALL